MMAKLSMLSLLTLALTIAILEHAAAAETFETVFATQPGGIPVLPAITIARIFRRTLARKWRASKST
jgi:hypothetical protein